MKVNNWLLLRGWSREVRHWSDFPVHLKRALGRGSKVIALDLPGAGTEFKRLSPLTVGGIVEDVRSRFTLIRPKGPCGILGLSLGGMVALEWLSKYPKDFESGVVINSSASDIGPFWKRLRPQAMRSLVEVVRKETHEDREREILKIVSNLRQDDAKVLEEWHKATSSAPVSITNAAAQLAAGASFKTPKHIAAALVILSSAEDKMVDEASSYLLAKRLDCKHFSHPTAGHDLTLDDPKWVAQHVAKYAAG
ncbi:MAG: alpha/beta hydrolase [Bdellovibrionales bacterium CG10_big_fil_rev_8_21_14_0_10_45_34]|nr:MAG: alpha/beta hydrolase [Bdellovibrionales bacterium CG10_big_fil_rev_8_21_14_0_10_45_34]